MSAPRAPGASPPESAAAPVSLRKSRRRVGRRRLRAILSHLHPSSSGFQGSFSLAAWKIDALARASASFADDIAWSKSPLSAALFAAAKAAAVTVHRLRERPAS